MKRLGREAGPGVTRFQLHRVTKSESGFLLTPAGRFIRSMSVTNAHSFASEHDPNECIFPGTSIMHEYAVVLPRRLKRWKRG